MGLIHLEFIIEALSGLILSALLLHLIVTLRWHSPRFYKKSITLAMKNEKYYRTAMKNAPIILSVIDAKGIFIFSEGRGIKTLSQDADDRIGRSIFNVYKDYPGLLSATRRALAGETLTIQQDIGPYTFDAQMTPMYDAKEQVIGVIFVALDVTERVRVEQALRHQACYDFVTGLPNQILLRERVTQELQTQERTNLALLLLDLDHFQEVNDTFGHQQGDLILQQVGQRLCHAVDASATVGRIGGDEFVILLPGADEENVREAMVSIYHVFDLPFLIEEFPMHIEASIGIALSSTHETDFSTLFRQADVAMYIAKRKHSGYIFYQPELDPYTPRRLGLLGALRAAIADNELALYYQPQIDLQTGIIHSVEALIRWNHPDYGCVPPDQFIPLAEQTGLIQPLSIWVLEEAIRQCANWLQRGIQLTISVNLSTHNLHEADLPTRIARLLTHYALPARYLCVEVTESAVMTDIGQAVEILNQISEMGIKIAIDDFGTGYSSLAYLKHLPVNELKIDRFFVKQMITDPIDATIVQSTVKMARDLGLKVVAEGVENQETSNLLADYACDCGQGYFWSRPVPALELELWLVKTKSVVVV
ncbi:MAG: EAL domain-containing protein [Ktedonobacteraceae bacterium]|nr:EAL domain-containing protein [Ktedonobacteraceae bacterium]